VSSAAEVPVEPSASTPQTQPRTKGKALRGAAVLLAGQVAGQVLGFVRNLVVAHLISVKDFGIAATFALTVTLLNMIGDLSVDKMLVQAPDGNQPKAQAAAQFVMFVRGLLAGAILFLAAGPIASAFDIPEVAWAFQMMAAVPVIRGFAHLDVRRYQREMRFMPSTVHDVAPQVVCTIAAVLLAVWLGDYRCLLYASLLQEAAAVLSSYWLAERRYAWSRDPELVRRLMVFGWPLMINGFLMFVMVQGDRMVVSASYSLDELGAYSLAFLLTMIPTAMLMRVLNSILLPVLSRAQNDQELYVRRTRLCARGVALLTAMFAVPLVAGGGVVILWLYGTKFSVAATVISWLAAMQAVRLLRATPTLSAMARADTFNSMMSNVWRSVALGAMAFAAWMRADLEWVAAAGVLGEILALVYCVARLSKKQSVPWTVTMSPALLILASAAAGLAATKLLPAGLPLFAVAILLQIATAGALLAVYPDLRRTVRESVTELKRRLHGRSAAPEPSR
jgi:O-antigen/teichoic acid export membrane protein